MVVNSHELYFIVFTYKYYQLTLLLVLIGKFESNFQPRLARTRPYKSRIGPKLGENVLFKSREWYYIVSI